MDIAVVGDKAVGKSTLVTSITASETHTVRLISQNCFEVDLFNETLSIEILEGSDPDPLSRGRKLKILLILFDLTVQVSRMFA